jgi:hypothetical protein
MRDLYHNIAVVQLLAPGDITTNDTYSSIVDLQDFEQCDIIVNFGVCTGATVNTYVTPILQESDSLTDAGFSSVSSSNYIGGLTKIDDLAEDNTVQHVGYIGSKRYLRVLLDVTSTMTNVPVSVTAILAGARHNPPTAPVALATTG